MAIEFTLNDEEIRWEDNDSEYLSNIIREHFNLLSLHEGCKQGFCGQCLVLVNDIPSASCLLPVHAVQGAIVETIEGLENQTGFADLEKGFMQAELNPCPHCAGIKAVLAEGLLRQGRVLSRADILASLPRHWCSCTAVEQFVNAVQISARMRNKRTDNGRK